MVLAWLRMCRDGESWSAGLEADNVLAFGWLLLGCGEIAAFEKRLLGEYALPNGYVYISGSGQHQIDHESLSASYVIRTFLNRIYVDDRYVLGEVSTREACADQDRRQGRYCYFVLGTVSGEYISGLNFQDFERRLPELGMGQDIKLVSRRENNWWKPVE